MTESFDLSHLDPSSFEHMVNQLAVYVLGYGHTGFGPGQDAGRDGYFYGEAPYPSTTERWEGSWYIQSKFHKPHLSKDPQKWLLARIEEEIKEFQKPDTKRKWPDNWIIATNIDPSGSPETGAFDRAKALVNAANPTLAEHFHIWGGSKIIALLNIHTEVAKFYGHFLTPGHVITALYDHIKDNQAEISTILYNLIVKQLGEQQNAKLEQAGSGTESRTGIHKLFIDLPFRAEEYNLNGLAINYLAHAANRNQRAHSKQPSDGTWKQWRQHPRRARAWFVKGGPGQGKSTIGQYFCQIQRAALVLEGDGLAVTSAVRELAEEIKSAAVRDNFWPLAPRIPISIELKDFAQWFGQKKLYDARGVLSYLAERLSASVEQPVLVGTLKRALQVRSWFVVFDGLDEVPHDVKDAVASQVSHFVNQIVLELNADVLTLCTSRPQGYSGQFSQLDAPIINLSNLEPEQALQCAKPVLSLNRSEEEAAKYFQILKSAIESSSVRELMTTPLQSHIMAIVVRGGGRPPERRWQLFTNFYEVIRNREANRDLPDPKLAKLLREDKQLLKTVHNRLGFLLHARAETSQGAQTKLERNEFKKLVTDAAKQMIETHTTDTIDTLMEATEERLVLVTTPDDGDHVRFDIRPLQEFFAAEFMYEYVTAESLKYRMELIAGDSHWPEVMHFLLSALIENGRATEMSVAIGVLQQLNEGTEDPTIRLLSRRLGRGGLLVARLLQEGVLEQDKRVRQLFRKCLEPLTAFTKINSLQLLIDIDQPNSQEWLHHFLLNSIRESDPSECIGAILILSHVLPDDSPFVEEVKNFILSSTPDFISWILLELNPGPYVEHDEAELTKNWFLEIVLYLLLRDEWGRLNSRAINAALNILRESLEKVHDIAKANGLSATDIELLEIILAHEDFSSMSTLDFDYGLLQGEYYKHSWATGTFEYDSLAGRLDDFSGAPGILNFLYRILRFGKTQQLSDLTPILNDPNISALHVIPNHISAYLPIDRWQSVPAQFDLLKSLSEHQLASLLRSGLQESKTLRKPTRNFKTGNEFSLEKWKKLVDDYPSIAFDMWTGELYTGLDPVELSENKEATNILVDKIIELPEIVLDTVQSWADLIKKAEEREDELRRALLSLPTRPESSRWHRRGISLTGFRLSLPAEANLLPHIAVNLIPDFELSNRTGSTVRVLGDIRRLISDFIGYDNRILRQIADDQNYDNDVRAAAYLIFMFTIDGGKKFLRETTLLDLYQPSSDTWILRKLVDCIGLLATEEDLVARTLMGSLIAKTRGNFKASSELERLLAHWRAVSYAPIQSAGVESEWLVQ